MVINHFHIMTIILLSLEAGVPLIVHAYAPTPLLLLLALLARLQHGLTTL
jgi:hypothetical protein